MRPLRLLCTVAFLFVLVFVTLVSFLQPSPQDRDGSTATSSRGGMSALFSFHPPASLFPPSAIISLTDDNTTIFLSRPALYGPLLPVDGLSGPLWVGSGFGDDTLVRDGTVVSAQGELGCSDIPGWTTERSQYSATGYENIKSASKDGKLVGAEIQNRDSSAQGDTSKEKHSVPQEDDYTDDYLHYPLQVGPLLKRRAGPEASAEHADIQSLQESAEIAGKIVLLSRGGCGFFEKTKWVQRRGGIALIVGDYTRNSRLIQMSANGDTSNVTIPSIFTAYTSAHLLSSLVPPENPSDGSDKGKVQEGQDSMQKGGKNSKNTIEKPTFTQPAAGPKETKALGSIAPKSNPPSRTMAKDEGPQEASWFSKLAKKLGFRRRDTNSLRSDSRRPPSSGRIAWVQSQDWDDSPKSEKTKKSSKKSPKKASNPQKDQPETQDSFVIGVHDWRDPDLVAHEKANQDAGTGSSPKDMSTTTTTAQTAQSTEMKNLKGGSRVPESGVYGASRLNKNSKTEQAVQQAEQNTDKSDDQGGWLGALFGHADLEETLAKDTKKAQEMYKKKVAPHFVQDQDFRDDQSRGSVGHEGLWVTLTPTSISTSPFFDTLLVLVISPLVTLTVVYVLLLLRSRIRRRRWRAPRSVVDRLPVRTYHTLSCSSSSTSSEASTPHSSSPTSPLLRSTPKAGLTRTRPRSATVSTIRESASAALERATAHITAREGGNIFKRKYKGRQIECVVCLEEYIDGQSRVMSLPCGHEFHAECM